MCRAVRTAVVVAVLALSAGGCASRGRSSSAASSGAGATATTSSSSATASASSSSAAGGVAVSPATGGPDQTFAVVFTARDAAGEANGARTGYTVAVTGGTGSCLGERTAQAGPAAAGFSVTVALDPARLGGRWCAGAHSVRVIEVQTPVCKPGTMCPQYVRVIGTLGTARFTVGS